VKAHRLRQPRGYTGSSRPRNGNGRYELWGRPKRGEKQAGHWIIRSASGDR